MNFCWFLLLWSSKSKPGSCKSDKDYKYSSGIPTKEMQQEHKAMEQMRDSNRRGKKPSNQKITSSKFIPCSHWWLNREAKKTRFDEALWLNKMSLRIEETMYTERFVFLHLQRHEIKGSNSSFSCMTMYLSPFAYILKFEEHVSFPLPCQPFSSTRRVQTPICV